MSNNTALNSLLPKAEVAEIVGYGSVAVLAAERDYHPVWIFVSAMGRTASGRRAYELSGYGWHTIDRELADLLREDPGT